MNKVTWPWFGIVGVASPGPTICGVRINLSTPRLPTDDEWLGPLRSFPDVESAIAALEEDDE
jgi:hypothetical protein